MKNSESQPPGRGSMPPKRITPRGALAVVSPDTPVGASPSAGTSAAVPPAAAASPVRTDRGSGPASDFEPRERSEGLSRAFNFVVAVLMLLAASPVMAIAAVLVRLTSRGPVLYTQTRVGLDRRWNRTRALNERRREDLGGTPFTIYKFRSMRVDAEANGIAVWATQNDDRITPIGNLLRKTRVDELPQLLNVIRGDMNIVGPRPERPSIFVRLREQIEEYPIRQRVKPGITGLAQIRQAYDTCLDDVRSKVGFDIEYLRHQSFWFDVRIMLSTVPVMIFRKGAH